MTSPRLLHHKELRSNTNVTERDPLVIQRSRRINSRSTNFLPECVGLKRHELPSHTSMWSRVLPTRLCGHVSFPHVSVATCRLSDVVRPSSNLVPLLCGSIPFSPHRPRWLTRDSSRCSHPVLFPTSLFTLPSPPLPSCPTPSPSLHPSPAPPHPAPRSLPVPSHTDCHIRPSSSLTYTHIHTHTYTHIHTHTHTHAHSDPCSLLAAATPRSRTVRATRPTRFSRGSARASSRSRAATGTPCLQPPR